jgi:hypothetical protein
LETAIDLLSKTKMHWLYANDQYWKLLQPQNNWYCFVVRIGKQRPGINDNGHVYVDYDC